MTKDFKGVDLGLSKQETQELQMFGPYFVNFIASLGWFVALEETPNAVEYGPWSTEDEACKFLQDNYKG